MRRKKAGWLYAARQGGSLQLQWSIAMTVPVDIDTAGTHCTSVASASTQ